MTIMDTMNDSQRTHISKPLSLFFKAKRHTSLTHDYNHCNATGESSQHTASVPSGTDPAPPSANPVPTGTATVQPAPPSAAPPSAGQQPHDTVFTEDRQPAAQPATPQPQQQQLPASTGGTTTSTTRVATTAVVTSAGETDTYDWRSQRSQ